MLTETFSKQHKPCMLLQSTAAKSSNTNNLADFFKSPYRSGKQGSFPLQQHGTHAMRTV
jgi:hypothetical protein